jgi:hypothetical protein
MSQFRGLQEYNFYESGVDRGSGVREKSKQIIELLSSNDIIRDEREKSRVLRNKFIGISNSGGRNVPNSYESSERNSHSDYNQSRYDSGSSGRYGNDRHSGSGNDTKSGFGSDNSRGFGSDNSRGFGSDTRSGYGNEDKRPSKYGEQTDRGGGFNTDGHNSFSDKNKSSWRDSETEDRSYDKPTIVRPPVSNASGGKLKVQIKKATGSQSAQAPVTTVDPFASNTPIVDLFNDDAHAAPSQSKKNDFSFDAFSVPPSQPAASFNAFDQPPVPPRSQPAAFDPFGGDSAFVSVPAKPTMQPSIFDSPSFSPPATQQQLPASFDLMSLSAPAPVNNSQYSQNSFAPAIPPVAQSVPMQQTAPLYMSLNGTPLASNSQVPLPTTTSTKSKGDMWGGLVDLGSIGQIEAPKSAPVSQMGTGVQSFNGLDGFPSGQPQQVYRKASYVIHLLILVF